jgi:hypothetical protein
MATAPAIINPKEVVRETRVSGRKKPEVSDAGMFFRYYGSAFNDVVISLCVPCRQFVAAATSMELLMNVERQHVCARERH